MTTYFVSRHAGAVGWSARRGIDAKVVEHFETDWVEPGDTVIGTLPVHTVAEINARGGKYLHLKMDIPQEMRGTELSADEMDRYGARLQEFRVEAVKSEFK